MTVDDDDDVWICSWCKKNFKGPNHKLLECEYCDKHYCIECVEITDKEYKIMTDISLIHWFCDEKLEKLKKLRRKVSKVP